MLSLLRTVRQQKEQRHRLWMLGLQPSDIEVTREGTPVLAVGRGQIRDWADLCLQCGSFRNQRIFWNITQALAQRAVKYGAIYLFNNTLLGVKDGPL